ncbi:hypothetical protein AWM75_00775 [Aerococcus urinaehominis]|uniref:Uncharacterized protein n=1 Tax=Aerococcus urinaehominis TaxID=128944 RepID=A0A0X8FJS3_9LACT|nr:Ig-like domain-containing protein [Aerococcus urinaehominis]AMB98615.1 hypothetical protein AWM75_00775 [Aerococcus urinaehominis]SDL95353.1 Collagen binding domain-containing protein [Aerococcus urinaehominis]
MIKKRYFTSVAAITAFLIVSNSEVLADQSQVGSYSDVSQEASFDSLQSSRSEFQDTSKDEKAEASGADSPADSEPSDLTNQSAEAEIDAEAKLSVENGRDLSAQAVVTDQKIIKDSKQITEGEKLGYWDQFQINHKVSFADDVVIHVGDTYTYQLPDIVRLPHSKSFTVFNEDQVAVGQGHADDSKQEIQVTFSDYFTNNPLNKSLKIWADVVFDKTKVTANSKQNLLGYDIHVGENNGIDADERLYQYGYITDKADIIQWVARINFAQAKYPNLTYQVALPSAQTLVSDSIEIIEAAINPSGNGYKVLRYLDPSQFVRFNAQGFVMNLGATLASYIVNYKTQALDGGKGDQYHNDVQITGQAQYRVSTPLVAAGGEANGDQAVTPEPKPNPQLPEQKPERPNRKPHCIIVFKWCQPFKWVNRLIYKWHNFLGRCWWGQAQTQMPHYQMPSYQPRKRSFYGRRIFINRFF